MNVLIIGSGGREHAISHGLSKSPNCDHIYVAPGNGGTASIATNIDIDILDFTQILDVIESNNIELVVVGPEQPLVNGVVDFLNEHSKATIVGPNMKAAQLEASKSFANRFLARHDIPTAQSLEVTEENFQEGLSHIEKSSGPYVLKADGLAAGKGVVIVDDPIEASEELQKMLKGKFGPAGNKVIIEQFLDGIEFSVFALSDGDSYQLLPIAKDYKRAGEGDTGLNTGGMGAVSPVPYITDDILRKVKEKIIKPTCEGLNAEEIEYKGFLFFGLMLVDQEPYVIEYNCRMGDPETEVVFPRVKTDWMDIFNAFGNRTLSDLALQIDPKTALTVVVVSDGYPKAYQKGNSIQIEELSSHLDLYHASTRNKNNLETSGGRVVSLTGYGSTIEEAQKSVYSEIDRIQFSGATYRKDIGNDLIKFRSV